MVDFPEPDSPTRANVLPGVMVSLASATARTMRRGCKASLRMSQGREMSKVFDRAETRTRGGSASGGFIAFRGRRAVFEKPARGACLRSLEKGRLLVFAPLHGKP